MRQKVKQPPFYVFLAGLFLSLLLSLTVLGKASAAGTWVEPLPGPQNPIVSSTKNVQNNYSCNWVNVQNISCQIPTSNNSTVTVKFVDQAGMDDYWAAANKSSYPQGTYLSGTQCGGNTDSISINPFSQAYTNQPKTPVAIIWIQPSNIATSDCTPVNFNKIVIGKGYNSNIFYEWSGSDIVRVDGDTGYTFVPNSTNTANVLEKINQVPNNCSDEIYFSQGGIDFNNSSAGRFLGGVNGQLWPAKSGGHPALPGYLAEPGHCAQNHNTSDLMDNPNPQNPSITVNSDPIFNLDKWGVSLHIGGQPPSNPGFGSNVTNQSQLTTPTCQSTGGPLSWITCAVIEGVERLERGLEGVISSMLQTNVINLKSGTCNRGSANSQNYSACIYNIWSDFRIYGDIFLVIVLIIIVYAEAAGGGLISAYTARKVLPRILLAAILINLSIYIIAGLEDIVNIVGKGIYGLISAPFKQANLWTINLTAGAGNAIFAGGGLLAIIAGVAFWKLIRNTNTSTTSVLGDAVGFLLLFVVLPVVLAILGVLVVIMLRAGLLVFLLLISPIAFALYCLPNTEQYFRKWWSLLTKTLLVYPIIMAIFALAGVTAVIMSSFQASLPPDTQWIGEIMTVLAVAAPMFLIPFAFKLAGGAIGGMHGAFTNFNKKTTATFKGNPNDPNSLANRTRRRFTTDRTAAGVTTAQLATRFNPKKIFSSRARDDARRRLAASQTAGLEMLRRQHEENPLARTSFQDSNVQGMLAEYRTDKAATEATNIWHASRLAEIRASSLSNAEKNKQINATEAEFNLRKDAIASAKLIGFDAASRRSAFLNPAFIKYKLPGGEEGWDAASAIAQEISNGNDLMYTTLMNEFQYIAKSAAARPDLAGNTDGKTDYSLDNATSASQNLYTLLNSTPAAIRALMDQHAVRLHDLIEKEATGLALTDDEKSEKQKSAVFLHEMHNAAIKGQGTSAIRDVINESGERQLTRNIGGKRVGLTAIGPSGSPVKLTAGNVYGEHIGLETNKILSSGAPVQTTAYEEEEYDLGDGTKAKRKVARQIQLPPAPILTPGSPPSIEEQKILANRETAARNNVLMDLGSLSRTYTPTSLDELNK